MILTFIYKLEFELVILYPAIIAGGQGTELMGPVNNNYLI